ncbi:MAG: hypothetical protein HRT47_05130 [Candidatus Caenarcaniphilales bacterium]|nr:hypothetical protein [Candidatus Caenarcaniphilales bacterium]
MVQLESSGIVSREDLPSIIGNSNNSFNSKEESSTTADDTKKNLIIKLSNTSELQTRDPKKLILKVGSNTIKAFFTDLVRDLYGESNVTNLGDNVKIGVGEQATYKLKEDKKEFALDVFKRIAQYAKEFNLTDIEFLATASIRNTEDGEELLDQGIAIFQKEFKNLIPENKIVKHIVPTSDEAKYAKEAVLYERGENSLTGKEPNLIVDLGGASGEITQVKSNETQSIAKNPNEEIVSLNLGSHPIIKHLEESQSFDATYSFIENEFLAHLNPSSINDPSTTLNLIGGKIRDLGEKLTSESEGISDYKPDAYDLYQGILVQENKLKKKLEGKLGNIKENEKLEEKAKSLSASMFMKVLLEKVYGKENLTTDKKDKGIFKKNQVHFLEAGMIQGYLHDLRKQRGIQNPLEGAVLPIRSINPRTLELGKKVAEWVKEKSTTINDQLKEQGSNLIKAKDEIERSVLEKAIEVAAPLSATFRLNNNLSSLKLINQQLKGMLSSVKFGFDENTNNKLKSFVRKLLLINFSGKPKELAELPGEEFKEFKDLKEKKKISELSNDNIAVTQVAQLMRLANLYSPGTPSELENLEVNVITKKDELKDISDIEIAIRSKKSDKDPLMLGDKIKKAFKRLNLAFMDTIKKVSSADFVKTVNS